MLAKRARERPVYVLVATHLPDAVDQLVQTAPLVLCARWRVRGGAAAGWCGEER